jgi:hypothetical protein
MPDHLPDRLKESLVKFPRGSLQFEIGIQTFNPEVQALISRRQDNAKAAENLTWLRRHTQAHVHADLIAGLPGEDLASFAAGFDRLVALDPQEIQVGILKRLRGSPISRHTDAYAIRYNPHPPYNILCSNSIDFATMQRLNRFARYWDLIANSGRFQRTKPLLLGDEPFARFMQFSDWLFATTRQTHQIALERLIALFYRGLIEELHVNTEDARAALVRDLDEGGIRSRPEFLRDEAEPTNKCSRQQPVQRTSIRQARHGERT